MSPIDLPAYAHVLQGRRVVWVAAGILIVTFGIIAYFSRDADIAGTVQGSALVAPAVVEVVRAAQGGVLDGVLVRHGEIVRAGQALILLDGTVEEIEWKQALEGVAEAAERLRLTRSRISAEQAERNRQVAFAEAQNAGVRAQARERVAGFGISGNTDSLLRHHRSGTHVEFDRITADLRQAAATLQRAYEMAADSNVAMAELALAERAVEAATLRVRRAQETLQARTIRAGRGGMVLVRHDAHSRGTPVSRGEEVLRIVDPAVWEAEIDVSTRDIVQVQRGDSVVLELTSEPWAGKRKARIAGIVTRYVTVTDGAVGSRPQVVRVIARLSDSIDRAAVRNEEVVVIAAEATIITGRTDLVTRLRERALSLVGAVR